MAEQIANLQSECGLSTSVQEFKEQYRFGLVEAVFEWARGMPFSEITNLTDVQEGRVYDVHCLSRTAGSRHSCKVPLKLYCLFLEALWPNGEILK